MRFAARLLAGCGALASFDALAHGGAGLEWIAGFFLLALGGVFASFVVHLAYGQATLALRFAGAFGFALLDVVASLVMGWALVMIGGKWWLASDAGFKATVFGLSLLPWILPVGLLMHAMRRRGVF